MEKRDIPLPKDLKQNQNHKEDCHNDKNHNPKETFYQVEVQERMKNHAQFDSVTNKVKPENQNQTHNARKEAHDVKMRQV